MDNLPTPRDSDEVPLEALLLEKQALRKQSSPKQLSLTLMCLLPRIPTKKQLNGMVPSDR
jgi:hypothetical protein